MSERQRLIDANALILEHGNDITNWDKPCAVYITSIENAPTVDAVEVVHGRWIKAECSEKDGNANCSECGHWDWNDCNYCPNCGAKMDKKEE